MFIKENDTVLFQGDSITDCDRDKNILRKRDADSLGCGYVRHVAGEWSMRYPNMSVKFYNRGISGDTTVDLLKRWDKDAADTKPTVISIYIGINDVCKNISTELFFENYRSILLKAASVTDRLLIFEPFFIPLLSLFDRGERFWRNLAEKQNICKDFAAKYSAKYISLGNIMNEAFEIRQDDWWTSDGVHPSDAGHALISKYVLEVFEE